MAGVDVLAGKIVSLDRSEANAAIGAKLKVQKCIRVLRAVLIRL